MLNVSMCMYTVYTFLYVYIIYAYLCSMYYVYMFIDTDVWAHLSADTHLWFGAGWRVWRPLGGSTPGGCWEVGGPHPVLSWLWMHRLCPWRSESGENSGSLMFGGH